MSIRRRKGSRDRLAVRLPRVLGAVVVMATVVTLSSVVPSQASSSKTPYLIASPIDLTGSQAALGASLSAGLNAAVAQINGSGGNSRTPRQGDL